MVCLQILRAPKSTESYLFFLEMRLLICLQIFAFQLYALDVSSEGTLSVQF